MSDVDPIRVLHVDDDPEIIELASTFLEREDDRLSVEPAETAEDALDRIEAGDLHCLISDYQLPDMECDEFVDAIHDREPGLPFILFTGRDRTQLDDDLLAGSVTAYLQKGSGTEQYGDLADAIIEAVAAYENTQPDGGVRTDGGRDPERVPDGGGHTGGGKPGEAVIDIGDEEIVLEGALDAIEDAFFILDSDYDLIYWNQRINDVTGYTDEEITEMDPLDFFVEGDRDRIVSALESIQETEAVSIEATVAATDGEQIPAEFRGSSIENEAGELVGISGVARDISDRLAYERELERQNERLEELIGAVSHDLRNPLNVISGRIQLARELDDDEHFDALERAAKRMETLLRELVELGRQGHTVSETDEVSLREVAERSWESTATAEATLSVETEMALEAEWQRLRQLFENLFRNAVEHGGDQVSVTIGELEDGFYVADDGPGIPAEDRQSVFEYGESTAEDGTGLGLAIVRRVAEAHGWTVSVTDSDTGGARLEVSGIDESTPPAD
jgi:PAS domain S-box-containing protein